MVMEKRKKSDSDSVNSFADSGSLMSASSCSSNGSNNEIFSICELMQCSNNSWGSNIAGAVSVKNSSDVVIGPVTQFHGPVTILQNEDTLQNLKIVFKRNSPVSNGGTNGQVEQGEKLVESKWKHLQQKRILRPVIILIALLVCGIVTSAIAWTLVERNNSNFDFGDDEDDNGNITLGGKYHIFTKSTWGGHEPMYPMEKLVHPTTFSVICHTATSLVSTFRDCSNAILNMQTYHMNSLGQPDIYYNFVICGDANIYVGRGWDYNNGRMNDSIQIAFVGNYVFNELSDDMANAAQLLIRLGVEKQILSREYVLVGHNQTTRQTDSPGNNVYKIIKNWKHFFNGSVVDGQLVP